MSKPDLFYRRRRIRAGLFSRIFLTSLVISAGAAFSQQREAPPVIDPIVPPTVCLGEEVVIVVTATDPDGDTVSWSATNLPIGATFLDVADGTGVFNWTPMELGVFCVTFYASDGIFADTAIVCITVIDCGPGFVCGDADGNGAVNVSDVVNMVVYVFQGGPAPEPLLAGDVDCNGKVNISDGVYLISYIFTGGPEPCAECP